MKECIGVFCFTLFMGVVLAAGIPWFVVGYDYYMKFVIASFR